MCLEGLSVVLVSSRPAQSGGFLIEFFEKCLTWGFRLVAKPAVSKTATVGSSPTTPATARTSGKEQLS